MRWRRVVRPAMVVSAGMGMLSAGAFLTARADTAGCASTVCVSVDSSQTIEPADHQASGILHSSNGSPTDTALLAGLDVSMWRSSTDDWVGSASPWNSAVTDHIPVTFLLSDKWLQDTNGGQVTPWSDWNGYRQWVISSVQKIGAMGIRVDYWEVYNEPDGLPPTEAATVTPGRLLTQFLVAYDAIRSVIPNAAIIGPSTSGWIERPTSHSFSIQQFLDFADANGLTLTALSWHYNAANPQGIEREVAEARSLIAARPGLGNPKIFVNEYGTEQTQRIAGWDVQYLAAMTNAKVDSAGRSCWEQDCIHPVLDGLLATDGRSTLPDYWVRAIYAQMTGEMVATSSSSNRVGVIASVNLAQSEMRILLGYGQGCIQDPRCLISTPWAIPSLPVPVKLTVSVPWASGNVLVTETRVPGAAITPIPQPASKYLATYPVTNQLGKSLVTINLGQIQDGQALSLVFSHSG